VSTDEQRLHHAIGALAVFALDQLWIEDADGAGCCPTCCGPCIGLSSLLALGLLDAVVWATGDYFTGAAWWTENNEVDKEWLARAWRRRYCHEDPDIPEEERMAGTVEFPRPAYVTEVGRYVDGEPVPPREET